MSAIFRAQHHRVLHLAQAALSTTASMSTNPPTKEAARRAAKEALRRLSTEEMASESSAIAAHLRSTGLVSAVKTLCIYVHCARLREVDTAEALTEALALQETASQISNYASTAVFVPRVQDSDANMHFLRIHSTNELQSVPPFGILEPQPTTSDGVPRQDVADLHQQVDAVVMPGLAFDAHGRRLGRGGGYYDKFLEECWQRAEQNGWQPPLLAALAFKAQFLGDIEIPMDKHDKMVDLIITAEGVLRCSERAKQLEFPLKFR